MEMRVVPPMGYRQPMAAFSACSAVGLLVLAWPAGRSQQPKRVDTCFYCDEGKKRNKRYQARNNSVTIAW